MEILNYPKDFDIIKQKVINECEDEQVDDIVKNIINKVRLDGDQALNYYSKQFDQVNIPIKDLKVSKKELEFIEKKIPDDFKKAVKVAINNIKTFHKLQIPNDLFYEGKHGEKLGQKFTPIEEVGVYVPGGKGGKTPLISTLLMNVIPAQIAGCKRICSFTPPQMDGKINQYLLYTFSQLKLSEIYKGGGAQAIAALAFGTESINPVDIIVGPGNKYVTSAKKQVFGRVMIDGLYGHSEIVVVSDGKADPEHIACDLLSQAEHSGGELVILITDKVEHAKEVINKMNYHAKKLERQDTILSSTTKRGSVIIVENLIKNADSVINLINYIAPEHLELLVDNEQVYLEGIKHTGAIFVGEYASEPIGDYICGTNHVLPTGRSARFSSPLGVYTFLKRTNIIEYNQKGFNAYAPYAEVLAQVEGLTAHKRALNIRY